MALNAMDCLRAADTVVVQNASAKVAEAGPFGKFSFLPVTDGSFVKVRLSESLAGKSVRGKRVLSSNMANEGIPLSPPTTRTLEDFRAYLDVTFPSFGLKDKMLIEEIYSFAGDNLDVQPNATRFATSGTGTPTAVNQSEFGTGNQQRLSNLFAEYAFVCPSYWAVEAFPEGWKYQFSALPSYHGYDLQALWSKTRTPGKSFKHTFRKIWGNFIINNSPVISVQDAKGGVANSTVFPVEGYGSGNIQWPKWNVEEPVLLNLNSTGGRPYRVQTTVDLYYNTYSDPGVSNQISLADAATWEGGRGKRCEFWKNMASKIPY